MSQSLDNTLLRTTSHSNSRPGPSQSQSVQRRITGSPLSTSDFSSLPSRQTPHKLDYPVNSSKGSHNTMAGILSNDAYNALGQYPGKRRQIPFRLFFRLALIFTAVCTLGYFGVGFLRSSSLFNDSGVSRTELMDPRLLSAHCDIPHPGRPLIQYVLMIDAGSTGSRIHVYKFNYCKTNPELEDEVFKQLEPGLSSFKDNVDGAAHSLDGLMEVAMRSVPKSMHKCTPIAVKATAGLRMLGSEKSNYILNAVERHLREDYPFRLISNSPVEIMEGKNEGIYAWITVNYLLGTLGDSEHNTAATFDLGGGSTQIVFEPRFELWDKKTGGPKMASGEHRYEMTYGGQEYTLYQHSYLGYGLMEARKSIKTLIAQELFNAGKFSIDHPCFPPGFHEDVTVGDSKTQITLKGISKEGLKGQSASDACYKEVRKIFNKNAPCLTTPCTFDGVYQPNLAQTFAQNPFYIFSYFYDRTYPLGVRDEFSLSDFKSLTDKVCNYNMGLFNKDEQDEIVAENHYCLDLSYQYALLVDGVGMNQSRTVRSTRKIKDAETGWCLGASLAILSENNYCKI
ncbi:Guanosine-diphosphatase [Coemansia sp. RSA 1365]|nr:Guanosine-diphosphatase [Coemansia sp. RSA 1365]